jgi:hypothetical protein
MPPGAEGGVLGLAKRHRNLTVAAVFALMSLIAWSATLRTESSDRIFSGAVAYAVAGFIVFLLVNLYIVWLRVVPKARRLKGDDMSYRAALAHAGAAPLLGMGAAVTTGFSWPLWTCIVLGLISSIGPLSVLSITNRHK